MNVQKNNNVQKINNQVSWQWPPQAWEPEDQENVWTPPQNVKKQEEPTAQVGGKKKVASKKPVKKTQKGGAFMDDVKNLAVPFAILLAKQGLDRMKAKKTVEKKPKATPTPKKAPAQTGGAKKPQKSSNPVKKLTKQIDDFLKKH